MFTYLLIRGYTGVLLGMYMLKINILFYSYGWGERGEEGSSDDPGNIFYRGPKPFSEPETMAVKVSKLL
jgi:hypothetical protein